MVFPDTRFPLLKVNVREEPSFMVTVITSSESEAASSVGSLI